MPEMDGYELCHAVRQDESCSEVAFVFYSGTYLSVADWKFGMEAGADAFLDKDGPAKQLIVVARDLVSRTPAERKALRGQLLARPEFALQHRERLLQKLSEKEADLTRQTEELRDLESKLAVWLATSSAVLYTVKIRGSDLIPQWVSPNVRELTGFDADDVCRPGWWRERVHPADLPRPEFSVEVWNNQSAIIHEYRFLRCDGVYLWVRDERRGVRDLSGRLLEIVGILTNISEQKIFRAGPDYGSVGPRNVGSRGSRRELGRLCSVFFRKL